MYLPGDVSRSFWIDLRGGDDDLCIDQMLIEGGVFTLLIGRRNQLVALVFYPFPEPELILGRPKQFWNFFGVFMALIMFKHQQLKSAPLCNNRFDLMFPTVQPEVTRDTYIIQD